MSDSMNAHCGYCHWRGQSFATSAGGRQYCPECGAIPKEEQR